MASAEDKAPDGHPHPRPWSPPPPGRVPRKKEPLSPRDREATPPPHQGGAEEPIKAVTDELLSSIWDEIFDELQVTSSSGGPGAETLAPEEEPSPATVHNERSEAAPPAAEETEGWSEESGAARLPEEDTLDGEADTPDVEPSVEEAAAPGEEVSFEGPPSFEEPAPEAVSPAPGAGMLGYRDKEDERFVTPLLHNGLVSLAQVRTALRMQPPGMPLWRMLVAQDGVDAEAVFAEVARVAGIPFDVPEPGTPTLAFVREALSLFPDEVGRRMIQMGLLPLSVYEVAEHQAYVLVLGTHDPLRAEVQALREELAFDIELRYVPARLVAQRIELLKTSGLDDTPEDALPDEEAAAASLSTWDVPTWDDAEASDEPITIYSDEDWYPEAAEAWGEGVPAPGSDGGAEETGTDHPDGFFSPAVDGTSVEEPASLPEDGQRPDPAGPVPALKTVSPFSFPAPPQGQAPETEGQAAAHTAEETPGDAGDPPIEVAVAAQVAQTKDRVVTALLLKKLVTPKQVAQVVTRQKETGEKELLWRLLARTPGIDAEKIYEEAARVYAFPAAEVDDERPDKEFVMLIMETVAEERREELLQLRLLPYEYDIDPQNGAARLIFITHDPARPEVHHTLQNLNLGRFELRYAPEAVIERLIGEVFPKKNEYLARISEEKVALDLGLSYEDRHNELIDEEALEAEINRSSLINLFEATLVEAVHQGASDIHIFPNPDRQIEIHFRVDGRLKRWFVEEKVHPESFLAVAKDNAMNVDRFERDKAQDGFIQRWIDGALIRFRVSVLPIASAAQEIRAESIVIRVLDDRKMITDLRELGMLDDALARFERAIRQPYGMVILTGPTGSGKSTTLVAALHQVVSPDINVLTVEDPVEYIIKGVRQIKLNHKLELEGALRAILRHDPDVVMVGEMRDRATAELAIKLANTGHLTFSTLHTNDAPSAISRLYKMGVEPFLIAYAINLVVAQRLIRRLCPSCKEVDPDPDPVMLRQLGFSEEEIATTTFYRARHNHPCKSCNGQGYKGRRAICETLYFTREIRHLIAEAGERIDEEAIRAKAIEDGMLTLRDAARELVKAGDTSVDEMVRVTASES